MENERADCVLMQSAVTSNAQGYFEFWDVPPGEYFIFYDSGTVDFNTGLERWGGETIRIGDLDWLLANFFFPNSEGGFSFLIPDGTPLRENTAAMMAYRFFFESPFFWAHGCGPKSCATVEDVRPVQVSVTEGRVNQVTFKVH